MDNLLLSIPLKLSDMYKDFLHCYHPKKIRNRNGDWITTSCGCCPACLARMSKKASYQCSLHEQDYKYCMFVTLTYSNDNVPLLRLEEFQDNGDNEHFYRMYDVTERFQAAKNIIGNYVANAIMTPYYVSQIRRKFRYFGSDVPYLSKYDAQCFLKRFRKHLNKFTDEKVSYYLVGEYGPIHFRPHFHVLFYFDSETILQNFREVLHSSWSLGFVDYSQSRGKCSTYVAQYVNCRNSVPRIYQDRAIRPFCLHSQKFAQRFYQNQKAEIYENEDFRFTDIMRSVGSSVSSTYAWRSLVSAFFPKCRGFYLLSPAELTYSYTLLSTAQKFYGKDCKISEIVELICRDLMHHSYTIGDFVYTKRTGSLSTCCTLFIAILLDVMILIFFRLLNVNGVFVICLWSSGYLLKVLLLLCSIFHHISLNLSVMVICVLFISVYNLYLGSISYVIMIILSLNMICRLLFYRIALTKIPLSSIIFMIMFLNVLMILESVILCYLTMMYVFIVT